MLHRFDAAFSIWLNGFIGQSGTFDRIVQDVLLYDSFKMMPLMAILIGLWFAPDQPRCRRIVLDGIIGGFIALIVTRLVQNLGPHQPRPIHDAALHLHALEGPQILEWSSFPSDTSAIAFALAFAAFRASRAAGAVALFWASIFVALPRLYGGLHFLSDIIVGAAIGIACVWLWSRLEFFSGRTFTISERFATDHRLFFHAFAFILAFQISTLFDDIRHSGETAWKTLGVVKSAVSGDTAQEAPAKISYRLPHHREKSAAVVHSTSASGDHRPPRYHPNPSI
jgi:undecaprenyl-diphosphatase